MRLATSHRFLEALSIVASTSSVSPSSIPPSSFPSVLTVAKSLATAHPLPSRISYSAAWMEFGLYPGRSRTTLGSMEGSRQPSWSTAHFRTWTRTPMICQPGATTSASSRLAWSTLAPTKDSRFSSRLPKECRTSGSWFGLAGGRRGST